MTRTVKLKLVVLGDQGCGKSSILNQYVNNNFVSNYQATIGVDFFKKTIKYEDTKYEMCIWDTSGQEKFSAIVSSYYRNITAVLLVFDLGNYSSFKNIKKWLDELEQYSNNDIVIRLIGNKNDIDFSRYQILDEEIKQFCDDYDLIYYNVSAKKNINVQKIFTSIILEIKDKLANGIIKPSKKNGLEVIDTFDIEPKPIINQGCCIIL